jgi:choline dehydrogenase
MRKCIVLGDSVDYRYHRGPASDYDRWAELTNDPSWSYDSLLPLFKNSEGFEDTTVQSDYITQNVSEKYHSRNGEWKISYQSYFHKISSYFIRATESIGIKFNPDFNAETTLGVGRIQTFVDAKDTARSNTEKAFLGSVIRARPNLSVLTSATCLRVVVENGKCSGAIVLHRGEEIFVRARRQVIVSCGAFDSPRILHSSGITLPGIGKNLQDHLGINVSFKIPDTFDKSIQTIDVYNGTLNKFLILFKYFMYRTGPAASNIGEAVAFYRTNLQHILSNDPSSGPESPHVELITVPLLTHHHEGQQSLKRTRPDFDWKQFEWNGRYITIISLLLNPFSRGEIMFHEGGMEIDPNYLDDQRDLDVLIEGVKLIRKIVKEGYPNVGIEGLEEMMPGEHVTSDLGIGAYIRGNTETYYHPVGTCKVEKLLLRC